MYARIAADRLILTVDAAELPEVETALMNGLLACGMLLKREPGLTSAWRLELKESGDWLQRLGDALAAAESREFSTSPAREIADPGETKR